MKCKNCGKEIIPCCLFCAKTKEWHHITGEHYCEGISVNEAEPELEFTGI